MLEKVKVRKVLQVFEKIRSYGSPTDDGYMLNGITATTDFDGYSAILKNDYVTLTVLFHNKFTFDYSNKKEKNLFLDKIDVIVKTNYKSES